ncbi:hypothetical protein SY83_09275 [Paenibacillus swuensis]|uniref:HAMP domain-containing protein n=1 Tax=Paenibacillus swuensis TaxID=1178515 RepID=A0A172THJ3_9BACL|nr:sensor histidine kinase [Paenibacillus swuensis]ANE46432.1 hypothetical protein SY83_09275 [Paenibacillus swuensis]
MSRRIFSTMNLKMRHKLLLSYCIVVMIPVAVIGYLFVQRTMSIVVEQHRYENRITFKQATANLTNELETYIKFTDSTLFDQQLMDYLSIEFPKTTDFFDLYKQLKNLATEYSNQFYALGKNVKVRFYSNNPTILKDDHVFYDINETVQSEAWYRSAIAANGKISTGGLQKNDGESHIILVRKISFMEKYTTVIRMDIPEKELHTLIAEEGKNRNKRIFLIDGDGRVLSAASERETIGSSLVLGELWEGGRVLGDRSHAEFEHAGNQLLYQQFGSHMMDQPWALVSISSPGTTLNPFYDLVRQSLAVVCTSILAAVVLMFYFSGKLTKRLKALVRNMSTIREGRFHVFVQDQAGDEIGELSRSFRHMVQRMDYLVSEVYTAEVHKKEAEIKALQSQINPHFLFNTLQSIQGHLLKGGDELSSDMVGRLARLFRRSLEWDNDMVTLACEAELAKDYLAIQKLRFQERLQYHVDVQQVPVNCIMPKFILQPLVENAVQHGLETLQRSVTIEVTAVLIEDTLTIRIYDNGGGMGKIRLAQVTKEMNAAGLDRPSCHMGLRNVHQRIQLAYGGEFGLTMESEPDRFTIVDIRLPLILEEDESQNEGVDPTCTTFLSQKTSLW